MKKLVGISLFVFFAAVTAIIIAGLVFNQESKINPPVLPSPSVLADSGVIVLDSQEVGKHNSATDCWTIINGKVYNLTSYLSVHPGGVVPMLSYCGKEASQAFATKDTSNAHSASANNLLANYYIGDFNQITSKVQIRQKIQATSQVTPPGRGEENDD